jgi:hypothetical protein
VNCTTVSTKAAIEVFIAKILVHDRQTFVWTELYHFLFLYWFHDESVLSLLLGTLDALAYLSYLFTKSTLF